jgi:hypothetical protein
VTVTIWTDWAFPVISFPLFLTGYDVQPINLYDIIFRGMIAPPRGTSTASPNARDSQGRSTNPNIGTTPLRNLANPNFLLTTAGDCASGRLPGQIPGMLATDVRAVLSVGRSTGAAIKCPAPDGTQQRVGSNHGGNVAVGYATLDVVATCSPLLPNDPRYFEQILFDNVLTGDYQQIASDPATGNYAGGNPMVHIRAIPEGGLPVGSSLFAAVTSDDVGGWVYFNLNSRSGAQFTRNVSQNWVVVSMFAEGRFGVDYDATSLGNGCSPASPLSTAARDENSVAGRIGPARNVNP